MKTFDLEGIKGYILQNDHLEVRLIEIGASIQGIRFAGREVALFSNDRKFYENNPECVGVMIGRYANRIAKAQFTLGNVTYHLTVNDHENNAHGGSDRPSSERIWHSEAVSENSVRFWLHSPDGDNGFPGNLTQEIVYTLTGNTLRLDFGGKCDQDTVYGPTSHCYFNLSERGSIMGTKMQIDAEHYVVVDEQLIPTGEIRSVEGSKFDFREMREITENYDNCFALDSQNAVRLEKDGIALSIRTNYPGVQVYTGIDLPEPFGKSGGIAVEAQFYPDSPNHPNFPFAPLKAWEEFHRFASYTFERV